MAQKDFCSRTYFVCGEGVPLTLDVKPAKKVSDVEAKLERVLALLEQLLARMEKQQAKQEQFKRLCAESQKRHDSYNPHRKKKGGSYDPNYEPPLARDTAVVRSNYEKMCLEAEAAYAARNPHKKG